MNRLALVVLAVAALAAALFLIAPWQDAELDPTEISPENEVATGPGAELMGSEDGKKGEELVSDSDAVPDRKEVGTAEIRVTGRLVGDVAGGTVVHLRLGKAQNNAYWPGMQTKRKQKDPDGVARTDAQGRFRFAVPLGKAGRISLASGSLVWSKRPPRFVGSKQDLDLGELPVHKGATLRGHVLLSTNDAPIADSKLQFVNYENFQIGPRSTESGADGAFTLDGLPAGEAYVTVSRAGHMTRYVRVELERGKTREQFVIRLSRGEQLVGRVVDDRAKPVVGASITVSGRGRRTEDGGWEYSNGNAKTNEAGEFRVTGLGSGPFTVNASAKGHVGFSRGNLKREDGPVHVELTRKGVVAGTVTDEQGAPMVGSRVHATHKDPNAKPRSRRSVEAAMSLDIVDETMAEDMFISHQGGSGGVRTDAQGAFELTDVKPGKIWLVATGGHRRAVFGPVQVAAGARVEAIAIEAERGAVVLIRIVDPDGEPLEKVAVTLRRRSKAGKGAQAGNQMHAVMDGLAMSLPVMVSRMGSPGSATKKGTTDAKGECEIAGLAAGEYEVSARHKSWVSPKPVTVKVAAKAREETSVAMQAGGTIEIRVQDHNGKPVPEQSFRVVQKPSDASVDPKAKKQKRNSGASRSGRTDATGRASVGPLAAGQYEAFLQLTGGDAGGMLGMWGHYNSGQRGKEFGERVPFVVKANQTVEVELVRPELGTLLGSVSDASGPVRNGKVVLAPRPVKNENGNVGYVNFSSGLKRGRTDETGAFRFEGLQPGSYVLSVRRKKGQLSFRQEIEVGGPGEHRKDVFLVTGEVSVETHLDGSPRAGVVVTMRPVQGNPYGAMIFQMDGSSQTATATTDAKGVAHFPEVPPGKYRLRLGGKQFMQPNSSDHVVVERGGSTTKKLVLRKAAAVKFVATAASGTRKVMMFRVELTPDGEKKPVKRPWLQGTSGTVESLAPGRYTFRAMRHNPMPTPTPRAKPPLWTQPQTIELKSGETLTVKIVLP